MTHDEESALNEFLDDISCLNELKKWETGFNIFDVLNIARNEIRHSNVLSWLLNPNGDHGLGDSVLYGVLSEMLASNPESKFKQTKLLLLDLSSFDVRREEEHIDLLLVSQKERFVIAIENKTFTGEHDNQLNRYMEYIEKHFNGFDALYLYLTPHGDESSDSGNWLSLSYDAIYKSVEKAMNETHVEDDVKAFIGNYLEILRRDIMEDQELKNVCNKIYEKHKKALDLIFNNCERGNGRYYSAIKSALADLAGEGKILYPDPNGTTFYLEEVDRILPLMPENNSSWGTNRCYLCWFEIDWKNRLVAHFELGGFNLSEEQYYVHQKLIENGNAKYKKKETYQFKRIEKVQEQIKEDEDSFDDIKIIAKASAEKLINKIHELLQKCSLKVE